MTAQPLLIAQVSDLHIRESRKLAYNRVDTAGAMEACVTHLNALTPRPDIVLFTGDMGDVGAAGEYAVLRDILADLDLPYVIVPGNHDSRSALHAAFPEAAPLNADGFVQFVVDLPPLRLVGLDSHEPGRSEGVLCDRRLDWLDATLAEAPDTPTVLFLHHPPFQTGIHHMDVQNLVEGADRLAAIVSKTPGIRAILCGHLHRAIHTMWAGVPISCVPSPAHQVDLDLTPDGPPAFVMEPPGLHLHRWTTDGGLMTHLSVIGDFGGRAPFFGPDGRLIT